MHSQDDAEYQLLHTSYPGQCSSDDTCRRDLRPATKLTVYPCLVLALYLAWSATWSGYNYTLPGRSGCSATLSGYSGN